MHLLPLLLLPLLLLGALSCVTAAPKRELRSSSSASESERGALEAQVLSDQRGLNSAELRSM
eukprot:scaffold193_cov255-Pinguiococcus_pyrenoidosus.AAC.44